MLEALIITLREGVEAALVVGIIVAFLQREERGHLLGAVWAGLAAAVAASFAGAWALRSWAVNEEAFEGVLYLASAVIVGSMMVWMWRNVRHISRGMKSSLARITEGRSQGAVLVGLFLFTFLMVFREGVETVLFLAAVSLTSSGLATVLGTTIGLALAVWFGVLFIRGSLRIDLGRFLTVTGIALFIFVLQLLVNGYHELAEAHWLPANPTSMGLVGPLVSNDFFFIAAILALPLLALAVPGRAAEVAAEPAANPAEERLRKHRAQRQRRARVWGSAVGIGILALLGLGFTYNTKPAELSPAQGVALAADGTARIPVEELADEDLHRFSVDLDGVTVRFIALQLEPGRVVTAFDGCVICGPLGYYQQGPEILCMHCGSAIYPPSIGQAGGCNPIPLDARLEGRELVIGEAELRAGIPTFDSHAASEHDGH